MTAEVGQAEFGHAVRRWRERITPSDVGLPAGGRRRAPGLRREELGLLAGISDHLTPGVQRLLDRLSGTPVSVSDATWTMLTANHLWNALMGDRSCARGFECNVVWLHFLGETGLTAPGLVGTRVAQSPEQKESFERAMVADLRGAAARYPADQRLRRLIAELRAGSARFTELWESGVVGHHESSRKTMIHPEVGPIELDCDVLTVAGSDLRIVAYTAEPGSAAADRLALLAVIGTQALT